MRRNFEKDKEAIWTRWEKALGMPLSQDFRDSIEANVEVIAGEPDIALKDLDGLIKEFFDKRELLEYFSSRKKPKGSTPKKRYQRCFEKRLYLVEFVMGRRLPIASWLSKSFALRKRFNWKQICTEWNEAHPNDHMSLEALKVRYYHAITEEDIQQEYLKRRFIRVPMNVGAEVYDFVKITDSEGNVRIGNIGTIVRRFENGKFTMDIRLLGDELGGAKSSPEKYQKEAQNERLNKAKG